MDQVTNAKNASSNWNASRIGFWSSFLAATFSIVFLATAALGGSGLGILKLPWDPDIPDAFSLLLAWSFLIMTVCLHQAAPEEKKLGSQIGLSFTLLYAAIVSIVYFVIITVVTPLIQSGRTDEVRLLTFNTSGSLMQSLDGLGYGLQSLATLFAAFAFGGSRIARYAKWAFVFNGVLALPILLSYAPLVVPQPYYTPFLVLAALWAVSLPLATVMTAMHFRKSSMN